MKISALKLITACFTSIVLFSCQRTQDKTVLSLGHGLSTEHSVHQAMLFMGKRLQEISGGKMEMRVYPSEQLGTERECLELLQLGSLSMTKVSAAVMENFAPKYSVLGLPYLFNSKQHAFDMLDSEIGEEILVSGQNFWLRGLGFYDAGSRSFYTKGGSVETPADLQGLKIRVMESATAFAMIKAMGGSPTPVSWGELYTALQSGVVDAAENNPPSFYLSRHYEVCKYYSIDEHTQVPDVLLISKIVWDKLSEQEQEWVQQAADESVEYQRVLWEESEKEALEAVEKAGVTITYPDKKAFKEAVQPIYEYYKNNNKQLYSLIEKIQAAGK